MPLRAAAVGLHFPATMRLPGAAAGLSAATTHVHVAQQAEDWQVVAAVGSAAAAMGSVAVAVGWHTAAEGTAAVTPQAAEAVG